MDKFEKREILEEFLIKWKTGRSIRVAEEHLLEKYNPIDVKECRKIFEKWTTSGKSWKDIDKMK